MPNSRTPEGRWRLDLNDYREPLTMDERRVYRQIALPVSAFDTLQQLKREWRLSTNAEVLTQLLLAERQRLMMENDEYDAKARQNHRI
jgi:hypothetical protein